MYVIWGPHICPPGYTFHCSSLLCVHLYLPLVSSSLCLEDFPWHFLQSRSAGGESFSFYMSENIFILLLLVKDIFTGNRILSWYFFLPFGMLKVSLLFLACTVSAEKSPLSLCGGCLFLSLAHGSLFFVTGSEQLDGHEHRAVFFGLLVLRHAELLGLRLDTFPQMWTSSCSIFPAPLQGLWICMCPTSLQWCFSLS